MDLHIVNGRIGKIEELRGEKTDEKDGRVINFTLASSRYAKGKGRDREGNPTDWPTTWHRCVAFGAIAGRIADKFAVGNIAVVAGYTEESTYDKKDSDGNKTGEKATSIKIVVGQLEGPFTMANNSSEEAHDEQPATETKKPAAKAATASGGSKPASSNRPATQSKPASKPASRASNIDDDIPFN